MYWSRTGSAIDLLAWAILCLMWCVGGWLISAHIFRLRSRERLFTGIATGMLLFVFLSNLAARFLPVTVAFWGTSLAILGLGLIAAWRSDSGARFPRADLFVWPQIAVFTGLLILFTLINRGLAIFDDYANLPLVSMIATGDIPPHFYLNPDKLLDFHYGLHLFGASLVRVGGFFPWSAFDLSKALTIALALILAWLWLRRFMKNSLALVFTGLLVLFGGGARWLLLLLSENSLQQIGEGIQLLGSAMQTGPDLYTVMASPWNIEGGGAFPFPFAFANGIFPPLSLALASSGALPQMTLFLLLLLARRQWQPLSGLVYGLVLASLGLTGEHLFVTLWIGILLAVLISGWLRRKRTAGHPVLTLSKWGWVLIPGIVLVPFMGGVITEILRQGVEQLAGGSSGGVGMPGFGLRWPPAIISAHLGVLKLTDLQHILVGLLEMGAVFLLAPWMVWITWRDLRSGKIIQAGIGIAAALSFAAGLFIHFTERERDLSRLTGTALFIWLVLSLPYLWLTLRRSKSQAFKFLVAAGYIITIISGLAMFPPQMIAMSRTQYSYFVDEPDAIISNTYWNQLDPQAQVLDLGYIFRAPTLFGRSSGRAYQTIYTPFPEFQKLVDHPDPAQIAQAGYDYIYLDKKTWLTFTSEQRQAFQDPCVRQIAEQRTALNDFRRLLDVQKCKITP